MVLLMTVFWALRVASAFVVRVSILQRLSFEFCEVLFSLDTVQQAWCVSQWYQVSSISYLTNNEYCTK